MGRVLGRPWGGTVTVSYLAQRRFTAAPADGHPEAVILSVSDLETLEETLDLLSTPGALDEIRAAEAEIARGEAVGADELRRLMEQRTRAEQGGE
jgi:PHD/YefM family antitoxin component YafN of YafNO toxin-antitoxin module